MKAVGAEISKVNPSVPEKVTEEYASAAIQTLPVQDNNESVEDKAVAATVSKVKPVKPCETKKCPEVTETEALISEVIATNDDTLDASAVIADETRIRPAKPAFVPEQGTEHIEDVVVPDYKGDGSDEPKEAVDSELERVIPVCPHRPIPEPLFISIVERVWVSLVNNTDKADVQINLAHIPDIPYSKVLGTPDISMFVTRAVNDLLYYYTKDEVDQLIEHIPIPAIIDHARDLLDGDDLCYVDPDEGEEIIIDDPGVTGTVLWGAESASQVALSVNGTSKLLLKSSALDGPLSRLSVLEGYFHEGAARNAERLDGHESNFFASSAGLAALSARVDDIDVGVTSVTKGEAVAGGAVTTSGSSVSVQFPILPTTLPASDVYPWAKKSSLDAADVPLLTTAKISNIENWITSKGYTTRLVDDLVNYYLKSEVYTKAEVAELISSINQFHFEIYPELPATGQTNVLYLIGPIGGTDVYDEYVYANNSWTRIGSTSIDLSGYVQITRTITAGTGLVGGGDLSANRSFALSPASIASLTLADTAVQPSDLSDYVNSIVTGQGNYISGVSKSGKILTFTYGTLPTTIALTNVTGAEDLQVIEALSGTGLLRRTGNATWEFDGNTYATASDLLAVSARVGTLESRTNWDNYFGIDSAGNIYVRDIDADTPRAFYNNGNISAGGLNSTGGGSGVDLDRVWESLTNNTDKPDVEINLAHIPTIPYSHISGTPVIPTVIDRARDLLDGDDLCYVDPEEGEEIIIDDPGVTGTVLWGAESANQVSLSVNGTSKLLLKAASLNGINASITTLLGYFSSGSARNALALENHGASYFATASGLTSLDTRVTALENAAFDPTEMWDLLGAGTNEQINLSHIPDITTTKITNLESWIASKAYITAAAIPTNVSAFNNDAGYLTAHQSLANYYTKAETDTEISDAIAALNLGAAAQRGVASTITASSTNLATSKAVYDYANAILSSAIKFQGVTTTALTDGATTNPIIIDGASYTANRGDEVIYGGKEFLYTGTKWQQLGDEESWALKTISITGEGYLTGGGTLAANRTIDLTSSAKEKVENGATAYGWGNHANAGYFLASNFTKQNIKTTLGISDWALASTKPSYAKGEVGLGDVDNLAASAYFTLLENDNNQLSITVGGTNKKLTVDYASQAGNASTLENHAASYFSTASALSVVSGRVTTLESRTNWDDYFGIDSNGNIYVRDIDANTPRTFYNNGNISAGGLNSSGGGSSVDLARVWESLTNNTDFPDEKINLAHIPTIPYSNISDTPTIIDRARNLLDADDLCYVDPDEGEEITIEDPGTTGTVLWGAESANQVSLSVNGTSKLLLKAAAIDGITSRIGTLEGYFSGGIARNAAQLNGHSTDYFATASALAALANQPATASTLGLIKIGAGLTIDDGVVSVTGQTQGTVTRVDLGSIPYSPNTNGVVSLPEYPTTLPASDVYAWAKASSLAVDSVPSLPWSKITSGTPNTLAGYGITDAKFSSAGVADKIRITLGSNYHDVLTAHQSLSGYATESWVGQQGFITKAVNDLTNYYLKGETYTKTEVESLIGAINQFHYEIAASTSAVDNPQSNVLYLIGPTGSGTDKYEEYVYDSTKTPAWIKIGDTSIDLSGYVTLDTTQTITGDKNFSGYVIFNSGDAVEFYDGASFDDEASFGGEINAYSNVNINDGNLTLSNQSMISLLNGAGVDPILIGWKGEHFDPFKITGRGVDIDGGISTQDTIITVGDVIADGDIVGYSFKKIDGTSSQFLKADGSVDSNTYLTQHQNSWGDVEDGDGQIVAPQAPGSTLIISGNGGTSVNAQNGGIVISSPAVSFGTAGADYRPLSVGDTTVNYLTEHQSLADYVTNTALSAWVGSQNINTLGTVTTGVWHGTKIANEYLTLDMSWSLVRASATYDTEDYIHAN